MELDGSTNRFRRKKCTVSQLPLPSTPSHITRWQKQFRHTLIEWAAVQVDPFGTNNLLTKDVVTYIWAVLCCIPQRPPNITVCHWFSVVDHMIIQCNAVIFSDAQRTCRQMPLTAGDCY